MAVEMRILGLLEVAEEAKAIELRGSKVRTLLAVLVLHANEVVSSDALVEALWGDAAPDSSANTLQGYISQLRKALGPDLIRTRSPGYLLDLPAEAVDALRFERLVKEGQEALDRADPATAAGVLSEALALWRGQALADFAFDSFAQLDIARLEELRLVATEDLADAELALGRHKELVGRLRSLVEVHPLRERLWGQLVVSLYRSGRQAEALRAVADIRRRLRDDLGIEPGVDLRRLEDDVLLQRPALTWHPQPLTDAQIPPSLPPPRSDFLGDRRAADELEVGTAPPSSALTEQGGVDKVLRVVIAEDNYLVREGAARLLGVAPDVDVVGSVADLPALLSAVEILSPHVVLTDIRMPPSQTDEGIQAAQRLRETHPDVGVVVLSQYVEPAFALALFDAGAKGRAYLLKDRLGDMAQLVHALREVARGGSVLDPSVVEAMVAGRVARRDDPLAHLTVREREVLAAMAEGRTNAGIAGALGLSERMVEKYSNSLFAKLGVSEERDVHRRVKAVLLYLGA